MQQPLRTFRVEFFESLYIDIPAASEAHALRTAKILNCHAGTLFFCKNNYAPNSWTANAVRPETQPQCQLLIDNLTRIKNLLPFASLPDHVAYPLKSRVQRGLRDLSALAF